MSINQYSNSTAILDYFYILSIPHPDTIILDAHKPNLVSQVQKVATAGFGREVSYESAISHSLTNKNLLFLAYQRGDLKTDLVGFLSTEEYSYPEGYGIYLSGIAILPEFQGQGLGGAMMSQAFNLPFRQFVGTTQSPLIYEFFLLFFKHVFPDLYNTPHAASISEIARKTVSSRRGYFIPETLVVRDLYPTCLYPTKYPWSKDQEINQFFKDRLIYPTPDHTTDGFVLIGEK